MDERQRQLDKEEGAKRWPQITAVITNDNIIKFISDWTQVHDPSPTGMDELKDALRQYLTEQLKEVSFSEMVDATAEYMSSILLNTLAKRLFEKEKH